MKLGERQNDDDLEKVRGTNGIRVWQTVRRGHTLEGLMVKVRIYHYPAISFWASAREM